MHDNAETVCVFHRLKRKDFESKNDKTNIK